MLTDGQDLALQTGLCFWKGNDIWVFSSCAVPAEECMQSSYKYILPSLKFSGVSDNGTSMALGGHMGCLAGGPCADAVGRVEEDGLSCVVLFVSKARMHELAQSVCAGSGIEFTRQNLGYDSSLCCLIKIFVEECKGMLPGCQLVFSCLETQIMIAVIRQLMQGVPEEASSYNYPHANYIKKAVEFLKENYKEEYSLENVATLANLSPYYFIKVFKSQIGKTPYEFLLDVKIEKAKELLRLKNHTITEVCFASGFNNVSHFVTTFKKRVGTSPSVYRKSV